MWTPNLSANCILVADDAVAQDKFNVRVLKSLAPDGVKVFVATVEGAIKGLLKDPVPGERVLVLTKSPIAIRGERKPFIKNVAADPDEVVAIEQMRAAGVHVYYQLVPEQAVIEVDDALARAHEGE